MIYRFLLFCVFQAALITTLFSCNKNKQVSPAIANQTEHPFENIDTTSLMKSLADYDQEYNFRSDSGELIKINLIKEKDSAFAKIKRVGKPDFLLPQVSSSINEATYQNNSIKLNIETGNAIFFENGVKQDLHVLVPNQITYKSENDDLVATYISDDSKDKVVLKKSDGSLLKLDQSENKNNYSNSSGVSWTLNQNQGTLIEKGKSTKYIASDL